MLLLARALNIAQGIVAAGKNVKELKAGQLTAVLIFAGVGIEDQYELPKNLQISVVCDKLHQPKSFDLP